MPKLIDLTGSVFGRLTVLRKAGKNEKGVSMWECQCSCGKVVLARGDALRYGHTTSCGCLAKEIHSQRCKTLFNGKQSPKLKDLTGKIFGRLTVIRRLSEEEGARRGQAKWLCRCECGRITHPSSNALLSGKTKSCGCLGLENATKAKIKHGDALYRRTERLYQIWSAMKRRCENPHVSQWKYYGGKGVTVCEEWREYAAFKAWALANGYASDLTIDRIDSNGHYEPSNCRWITAFENSSRAHLANEETRQAAVEMVRQGAKLVQVSKELGFRPHTIALWCEKAGVTSFRTKYPQEKRDKVLELKAQGVSVKEILQIVGIGYTTYARWTKGKI